MKKPKINDINICPEIYNIPNVDKDFYGRQDIIDNIKEGLRKLKIVVIVGISGVGKTMLALNVAKILAKDYANNCRWIAASDKTLIKSLGDLAVCLKINEKNLQKKIQSAYKLLESRSKCLLIFDDVRDYASIKKYLPNNSNNIRVIITSENLKAWRKFERIIIDPDSDSNKNDIECYIKARLQRINLIASPNEIKTFSDELGCLFLAIEQALQYIERSPGLTLNDYLKLFTKEKEKLLDLIIDNEHYEYNKTVFTTFYLSLQKIKKINLLSYKIITSCAYLHENTIDKIMLQDYFSNESKFFDAISELSAYALIDCYNSDNAIFYKVHKLCQTVIQIIIERGDEDNIREFISGALNILCNKIRPLFGIETKNKTPSQPVLNSIDIVKSKSIYVRSSPKKMQFITTITLHAKKIVNHFKRLENIYEFNESNFKDIAEIYYFLGIFYLDFENDIKKAKEYFDLAIIHFDKTQSYEHLDLNWKINRQLYKTYLRNAKKAKTNDLKVRYLKTASFYLNEYIRKYNQENLQSLCDQYNYYRSNLDYYLQKSVNPNSETIQINWKKTNDNHTKAINYLKTAKSIVNLNDKLGQALIAHYYGLHFRTLGRYNFKYPKEGSLLSKKINFATAASYFIDALSLKIEAKDNWEAGRTSHELSRTFLLLFKVTNDKDHLKLSLDFLKEATIYFYRTGTILINKKTCDLIIEFADIFYYINKLNCLQLRLFADDILNKVNRKNKTNKNIINQLYSELGLNKNQKKIYECATFKEYSGLTQDDIKDKYRHRDLRDNFKPKNFSITNFFNTLDLSSVINNIEGANDSNLSQTDYDIESNISLNEFSSEQSDDYSSNDLLNESNDKQLGWNCFDIAVSLGNRDNFVYWVLQNADDENFRQLLTPEILHAAGQTSAYLNEPEANQVIPNILPCSMRTEELKNILNTYYQTHEKTVIRNMVAECNQAMGRQEGQYLPLGEVKSFFDNIINQQKYSNIYAHFKQVYQQHYIPVERKLYDFCNRKNTFIAYVNDYYGKNNWFAFQRSFSGESFTSSMIDIAAKYLEKHIIIYQKEHGQYKEIYKTKDKYKESVQIEYLNNNHFIKLSENVQKIVPTISNTNIIKNSSKLSLSVFESEQDVQRDKLHAEEIVKEKLAKRIPSHFQLGEAIGRGDCFFDAMAQSLNALKGKKEYTAKSLRLLCDDYVKSGKHVWIKEAIEDDGYDYNHYLIRIPFTAEELEEEEKASTGLKLEDIVWGKPEIEGRIICKITNIKLHVIGILEESIQRTDVVEQLVDAQASDPITPIEKGPYDSSDIVHLVNYQNHFVPLLDSRISQIEKPLAQFTKYSQNHIYNWGNIPHTGIEVAKKFLLFNNKRTQSSLFRVNKVWNSLSTHKIK